MKAPSAPKPSKIIKHSRRLSEELKQATVHKNAKRIRILNKDNNKILQRLFKGEG